MLFTDEAREQVRQRLDVDTFREHLKQRVIAERCLVEAVKRRDLPNWQLDNLNLVNLLEVDKEIIENRRLLYSNFLNVVMTQLPQPALIDADDLQQLALSQLGATHVSDFSHSYDKLIGLVLLRISDLTRGESLNLGEWSPVGFDHDEQESLFTDGLADFPNDFRLRINSPSPDPELLSVLGGEITLLGCLTGTCTPLAMNRFHRQVGPMIESLVRSLKLSVTNTMMEAVLNWHAKLEKSLQWGDDESLHKMPEHPAPPIAWLYSDEFAQIVGVVLNCLHTDTPFARRVRNAVTLIRHADEHSNDAIALSFCVSAIEAMICSDNRRVGGQLRRRIPALLQGNPEMATRCSGAIKQMYNLRSRCLHGDALKVQSQQLMAVRKLTSALLRATGEWAYHKTGLGSLPENNDWMMALETATATPSCSRSIPGVAVELSEHLELFRRAFDMDRVQEILNEVDEE